MRSKSPQLERRVRALLSPLPLTPLHCPHKILCCTRNRTKSKTRMATRPAFWESVGARKSFDIPPLLLKGLLLERGRDECRAQASRASVRRASRRVKRREELEV
ncbi:hypothetical protein BHM03_00060204 [Ensete ventricosum]|nr:hypothetical protein BHM03_00060204 [Ensete ventricosum]